MQTKVVSKVFVVNSDGKLLILRRSPESRSRPMQWDLPGGHVDEGEQPLDAAIRETDEEAGIMLAPPTIHLVYAMTELASDDTSVTWLFYAAQTDKSAVQLSHEHVAFKWEHPTDALALFEYGRQIKGLEYVIQHNLISHG